MLHNSPIKILPYKLTPMKKKNVEETYESNADKLRIEQYPPNEVEENK